MALKIKKKWKKTPEKLENVLERLMDEWGSKAHKCLRDPQGGFLAAPREQDEAWYNYCLGVADGLNKAYKLLFGFAPERTLK